MTTIIEDTIKQERALQLMMVKDLMKDSTTIWLLFIFFGWSYGSLDKVELQIVYYLTFGGLGIWMLIRLFTLNGSIKDYNRAIAIRHGLTPQEMLQLGVY